MADFLTFANLVDECERVTKNYGGAKGNLIKHMINMVYIDEILAVDNMFPLHWLVDFDDTLASKAPSEITDITAADPGVITTDEAHGLVAGDIISIYNIVGTTELNNRMFRVNTAPTTTSLTLIDIDGLDAIDTTSLTAYSSGGDIVHRGIPLSTTGKNVQRILRCEWHGQQGMDPITYDGLEEDTTYWGESTSIPTYYYHRKKYTTAGAESNHLLWFYAADDAYDLRYWFEMRPSKLTEDAHVPLLPPQFHYAIVAGVATRLMEQSVQVENQVIWPGIYSAHLEAIRASNRKWYAENEHQFIPE